MKVSIAMATFNGSKFIVQQIESILQQDRLPDEIIISDDSSTDNTCLLIDNLLSTSSIEYKLVRNKNRLGYTQNFSTALELVSGDLIFLCDQDDYWFPQKISSVLSQAAINTDKLLFINDVLLTDSLLVPSAYTKSDLLSRSGLSLSQHGMGCAIAVRRQLLNVCLPIPTNVQGHDNWLNLVAESLDSRLFTPTVLQYYRRHNFNESKITSNNLSPRPSAFFQKLTKFDPVRVYQACHQVMVREKYLSIVLRQSIQNNVFNGKLDLIISILFELNIRKIFIYSKTVNPLRLLHGLFIVFYFNLSTKKCKIYEPRRLHSIVKDIISLFLLSYE